MRTIMNRHCNELRMLAVREFIEAEGNFCMTVWIGAEEPTCNTAMCIGGTGAYLMSLADERDARSYDENAVSDWLGIDREMGGRLFYCCNDNAPVHEAIDNKVWHRMHHITRAQALQAIDNVIKDGAPHWHVICADIDDEYRERGGWR